MSDNLTAIITALIVAVLGPAGFVFLIWGPNGWLDRRRKSAAGTTTPPAVAAAAETMAAAEDTGLIDRWQSYADAMEARLNGRLNRLEAALSAAERDKLELIQYAERLRMHVYRQLPPPPPEWPEGLVSVRYQSLPPGVD